MGLHLAKGRMVKHQRCRQLHLVKLRGETAAELDGAKRVEAQLHEWRIEVSAGPYDFARCLLHCRRHLSGAWSEHWIRD